MNELIIVRGLPGSGKSTYAKDHFPNHLIYEPDHLFCDITGKYRFDAQLWNDAHEWVLKLVDFALARKEKVVVCDVFPTIKSLEEYQLLADTYDIELTVFNMTKSHGSIHHVPITIIKEMCKKWEHIPNEIEI